MEAQERARHAAAAAADQRGVADAANPADNAGVPENAAAPAEVPRPPTAEPPPAHDAQPAALEPETTETARPQRRDKTTRFRPDADFIPAFYRVVSDQGADVHAQQPDTGWPSPSRRITRTVPPNQIVLCLDQQLYQFEAGTDVVLLHIPDGWIRQDAVEEVCRLQKKNGEWVPSNDFFGR